MRETITRIRKTLTANDLGLTGSHQVGIVVPKRFAHSTFFPLLPYDDVNPRRSISFIDADTGINVLTNFIYYNNKKRGKTRDEFRITGIMGFCRSKDAQIGDILEMRHLEDGRRTLQVRRDPLVRPPNNEESKDELIKVALSDTWVVVGRIK